MKKSGLEFIFLLVCGMRIMTTVWLACLCLGSAGCSKKLKSGTAVISDGSEDTSRSVPGRPDQWLGHLGSNRNGHADHQWKNDWLDQEPELLWRKELGKGAAGIVVANGLVVGVGNNAGSDTVYCLSADDGSEQWKLSYKCPEGKRMFEGGPAATPTIDPVNRRVYVLSHQGELRCIDMLTGRLIWIVDYQKDLQGRLPQYGFAGAPLLSGDVLIVQPGGDQGSVVGLDPLTGRKLWAGGRDKLSYSSPVSFSHGGKEMIASFNAHGLSVLAVPGGDLVARIPWETQYQINAATPCYYAGHLFIASGYGKGAGLISLEGNNAQLVYETRDIVCQFQSPVRSGGFIYVVSGDNSSKARLCCLRFDNGSVQWSEALGGNRGNVVIAGDKLVVLTEKGEALLCDVTPKGYADRGRFQALGGRCWASPAIAEGKLIVRNNAGRVICYGL